MLSTSRLNHLVARRSRKVQGRKARNTPFLSARNFALASRHLKPDVKPPRRPSPSISSVGSTMGQVKPKSDNKWVLGV